LGIRSPAKQVSVFKEWSRPGQYFVISYHVQQCIAKTGLKPICNCEYAARHDPQIHL